MFSQFIGKLGYCTSFSGWRAVVLVYQDPTEFIDAHEGFNGFVGLDATQSFAKSIYIVVDAHGTNSLEKQIITGESQSREGNSSQVWDGGICHEIHLDFPNKLGGVLHEQCHVFSRVSIDGHLLELFLEVLNLGLRGPIDLGEDCHEQFGSESVIQVNRQLEIVFEVFSAGVQHGFSRPQHVDAIPLADRKPGGSGGRIDYTLSEQVIAPSVDDGRGASTRFLQHVQDGAIGSDNMENDFHAVLDHSFFKGGNGGDHCIGIGFVWYAEQQTWRITTPKMMLVFNGRHGGETFDNISVEFTHASSTWRVLSLPTSTMSRPDSSR